MISLSKEALQLFLSDLPHLSNIWISTAEAVILDRRIRERTQDIKRNTQVLLDLIQEDGTELDGRWEDMLLDPRIEPPSAREELCSAERISPEPQLPAAEHSGDATASECVPNVVPPPISDATNADMEPKLYISGLREDVNKTKRVEPGLIHQTPESGLVVADLGNLAKTEPSHDSATTRNTSPADTVVNPLLFDSGSRLANVKLILYMWRDVFFVGVYLLQQVLGSASDTWSHLWGSETQVPAEMSRVKWKCSCGVSMYDDFIELRQGAAERLANSLNEDYENTRSKLSGHPSNSLHGTFKSFCIAAFKPFLTLSGFKSDQPGLPHHEMHILPGDSNSEGIKSILPDPLWLLLCHDEGLYASKLAQLKVDDCESDQKLFSALRNEYTALRGKWRSKISFRTLKDIKFVGFEVHSGELVDIRPEEDIPPIDNTDYCYNPVPADLIPPIGHRHLMHLFQHPLHAQPTRVCYDRFPKKLRTRLACSDKPTELGWGIHLMEGWSLKKIWISGFVLSGIGSLIFGVVWVVLKHSIQDAFTVASYWLTLGMFSIGTLQAILHLN
ncbi:hypothetical protein IFR04_014203 [Cadophora malorum]|uniref:Uncharacterized protein n=1 Tax=Cadophora malorum TaxID=108018 RepID=A0A8H7W2F8_9HELO|nr:hypothetical protein IFR04_014203 [Cadophora malorum]